MLDQLLAIDHGLSLIEEACNMSRHYFVSKFLQEMSIIIILLSCLSFHDSNLLNWLLFIINLLSKKCMIELMKSINNSFTNVIRHDLVRVRKIYKLLHHSAASIKLYILTYLL